MTEYYFLHFEFILPWFSIYWNRVKNMKSEPKLNNQNWISKSKLQFWKFLAFPSSVWHCSGPQGQWRFLAGQRNNDEKNRSQSEIKKQVLFVIQKFGQSKTIKKQDFQDLFYRDFDRPTEVLDGGRAKKHSIFKRANLVEMSIWYPEMKTNKQWWHCRYLGIVDLGIVKGTPPHILSAMVAIWDVVIVRKGNKATS